MDNTTSQTVAEHKLGTSVTILPTAIEARKMFLESLGKYRTDDGSNAKRLGLFLTTMERVTSQRGSFSYFDVIRESRGFELPLDQAEEFFECWIDMMTKLNKIAVVPSVYDYPLYVLIA